MKRDVRSLRQCDQSLKLDLHRGCVTDEMSQHAFVDYSRQLGRIGALEDLALPDQTYRYPFLHDRRRHRFADRRVGVEAEEVGEPDVEAAMLRPPRPLPRQAGQGDQVADLLRLVDAVKLKERLDIEIGRA